jgi:hypothetical protein
MPKSMPTLSVEPAGEIITTLTTGVPFQSPPENIRGGVRTLLVDAVLAVKAVLVDRHGSGGSGTGR